MSEVCAALDEIERRRQILLPQDIHGRNQADVQKLQRLVAEVLGKSVGFRDRIRGGDEGPEMVVIPPGRFLMGSPVTACPDRTQIAAPGFRYRFIQATD